jgi:hypothetical protein
MASPWKDPMREWRRRQKRQVPPGAGWGTPPEPTRRYGWRVWFLPMFLWPLLLDLPIEILTGDLRGVLGACLGIGLAFLAASRMARGREGDSRQGARLLGVAAGLTAGLAAGFAAPLAVLLGFGAYFGARLITDDLPELPATEPPPAVSEKPAEAAVPEASLAQLARIRLLAPALPEATRLGRAADAMAAVLDDLTARPGRAPEARRFLAVHLDGLSRIVDRLEAGAAPPATLPDLLETLTQSATRLRETIRAQETEALDIQVKVLSDRLKQEGL